MDTKYQKLHYGDTVNSYRHKSSGRRNFHLWHKGIVIGTMVIYKQGRKQDRIYYDVACECGRTVRCVSWVLEHVSTPAVAPSMSETRLKIFLRLMGLEESQIAMRELVLQKQADDLLYPLRAFEQEIIRRRYGLEDIWEQESLQAIGDDHSLTRERIRQIEARALHKIRLGINENRTRQPTGRAAEPEQAALSKHGVASKA
jgi:hypothetical protein